MDLVGGGPLWAGREREAMLRGEDGWRWVQRGMFGGSGVGLGWFNGLLLFGDWVDKFRALIGY